MAKDKVETVETETTEVESVEEKPTVDVTSDEYLEELVEVTLFKDADKYNDDVIVTLNGENWQIQRGKAVSIPRKVKLVLDNSMQQGAAAADLDAEAQAQYESLKMIEGR